MGSKESIAAQEYSRGVGGLRRQDLEISFLVGTDGSMVNRRVFISNRGQLANRPMWTEMGDSIVILRGCPCPLVLRGHPDELSCLCWLARHMSTAPGS